MGRAWRSPRTARCDSTRAPVRGAAGGYRVIHGIGDGHLVIQIVAVTHRRDASHR
jgi:mRNA-degrading endonuclease RelE of RelBE toxin-antitoxin system